MTKQAIYESLESLAQGSLLTGASRLFAAIGYQSSRRIDLDDAAPATFAAAFDPDGRLAQRAALAEWRSAEMVFQIGSDELRQAAQLSLFDGAGFQPQLYGSFLFFAIDLLPKPDGRGYTRTQLATITREINRLFPMPVSVLFRFPQADTPGAQPQPRLTLAIVTHRPNRRDTSRDVLEKVSLIHAVRLANPHRAHVDILEDLSLASLRSAYAVAGFDDLQRAWARTLDITELNRRFYAEIANWYFWAISQVRFPDGAGERADLRNATSVIRLLTRLIFVWFLREKHLVPDALFRLADLKTLLNDTDPDATTFYKAILQNLFFGTLNTPMDDPKTPRQFRSPSRGTWPNAHHGINNLYRYQAMFTDPQRALELLRSIPFLNGGLFECLDPETERTPATLIDGFSDHKDNPLAVPNRLFFGGPAADIDTMLNQVYGSRGRKFRVRGLIDILDSYKFTVAENTPIEEEVALDPELLGQVFENLLAAYNPETETTARKETGSFYTPRNVVEYMVDESLLLVFRDALAGAAKINSDINATQPVLDDRLRALLAYNDLPAAEQFSATEIRHLIAAIDGLRMIDPACGSGAFPMGALQKLVYLLSKLDPGNRRWKARQEERAAEIPDAEAREAALQAIDEAFERNELDYGRKLYLIENCIYGVDIQTIAVQIAKLRCFIALLVDQRVDDAAPNRGVRPLPNLETRFVAANALRGIERPVEQLMFRDAEIERLERDLADVRSRHFSARTPRTKQRYRERDAALRGELAQALERDGWNGATARLLAGWNPYSQNDEAKFFDPEWMFGLTGGFDIVIANPPYVRQEQIKKDKDWLAKFYPEVYTGVADLYVYFYARAVQLLRDGGVLTFISSNKYFRAGYGQKLRDLLASKMTIAQLIDFGDAPVFTAIAYPSIIVAQKGTPDTSPPLLSQREKGPGGEGHSLLALNWNPSARVADFPQIVAEARRAAADHAPSAPLILQRTLTPDGWRLEGPATQKLLAKLRHAGKPLGEYVGGRFYYGIKTGFNEAFVVDRATRDRLIAEHPSSAEVLKPFLRGRDVKRWRVEFADWHLIKIESSENKKHPWWGKSEKEAERVFQRTYPAIHEWFQNYRIKLIDRYDQGKYFWELRACAYWQEFQMAKTLYPDIYEHQSFTYNAEEFYSGNTTYFIPTTEKWLTGLLNSTAVEWFYSQVSNRIRGGYLRAFSDYMRQIPIPSTSNPAPIEALVEQILAAKAVDARADVAGWEREIDERVYALYGLRPEEVRMIEESVGR